MAGGAPHLMSHTLALSNIDCIESLCWEQRVHKQRVRFFFLSAFKGNVARQTFSSLIFPCHPLWTQPAPQYKEIYEITSCIFAHTLAPMVSWYCKSNKILHIFHVVPAPLLNPTLHVSTRSHLWIKFDKTSKGCLWCLAFVTKCK